MSQAKKTLLTREQKQEYKRLFDQYDEDGSGYLEVEEIAKAFPDIFANFDQVHNLIANYDADTDNTLSFDEFIDFMQISE